MPDETLEPARFLTERQLAERLNVSMAMVQRWRVLRKGPPYVKIGKLVRYEWVQVERWLAAQPSGGEQV